MSIYFRVHPDKSNRDIYDEDGKLYDGDFNEVQPEVLTGNDVLLTTSPDEFKAMLAARQ